MFDLFRAAMIGNPPRDPQSSKGAALICFDMEDGPAFTSSGPRAARAESGLALTMMRTLRILA